MARDRRTPKQGKAGEPKGYMPPNPVDARGILSLLADRAKTPHARYQKKRAPRNKDGLGTNYAGFGDQYFRLKSSLVKQTRIMAKAGDRLVYPERTPEDKERLALVRAADAILREADETDSD